MFSLRRLAPGVVMLVSGCAPAPLPPWVITEPTILGLRLVVVEEGPNSVNLIPIPADRVRTQPLPGDTVELDLLIADADGIRDPNDFDPVWIRCPLTGARCFSWLRDPGNGLECTDDEQEVACVMGRGPVTRTVIPPLVDPNLWDAAMGTRRFAVVVGVPGERSSDDCVEELGNDPYTDLNGCLLAIHEFTLGPEQRLQQIRIASVDSAGLPPDFEFTPFLEQPGFNREIARIDFRTDDSPASFRAEPGEVTALPPFTELFVSEFGDPRDGPTDSPRLPFETSINSVLLPTLPHIYTTESGLLGGLGLTLRTGDVGQEFQLMVTLTSAGGWQTWDTFDFVVEGE